jgi:D-alanyl-D-alanine carboxypeptidase
MMTLYMVFDALERGKWSLNRKLPVSARAAAQPPSKLGLRKGQTIKAKDAILALVTKSANDVAVVLAEALGGTESNFAVLMTAKARQLGMSRTTFRNASGLHDSRQVTTARDMGLLAMALLRNFPQHYTYFSTRSFAFGGTRHGNHNRLLGTYQGADGIKTGYIRASGYNLVASARRGGRRVIGVLLGGKTAAQRNRQMASLLDAGFQGLDTTLADDLARPRVGLDMADVAPPPRRSVTAASSSPASSVAGRVWGLQVGAFADAASARRAAQRAVAATRSLTADGVIHVEPVGRRKALYQARIGNVGRAEASRACGILKKKKFKCMVFKLKQPLAVAEAASPAAFDRPLAKPQLLDEAVLEISAGEEVSDGERRWGIQVGAYRSSEPALTMATMASTTADELLRPGKIAVVERSQGSQTFYLARVHRLTRSSAEAACAKLRQAAIDCLIIEVVDETRAGWDAGAAMADLRRAADKPDVGDSPGGSLEQGGWGIQVGAFPAKKQARSVAQKAVRALPKSLKSADIKIAPLSTRTGGTVYRARLVGIEKRTAYQACRQLSLQRFKCMVLRVDDQSVASAS